MKNSRLPNVQVSPCLRIFVESLLKDMEEAISVDEFFLSEGPLATSPALVPIASLGPDRNYN